MVSMQYLATIIKVFANECGSLFVTVKDVTGKGYVSAVRLSTRELLDNYVVNDLSELIGQRAYVIIPTPPNEARVVLEGEKE